MTELWDHWETLEKRIAEGERVIRPWEMPPWDDICSQLDWRTHLIDEHYFSKKRYGFRGVYRLIALAAEGDLKKPLALNRICGPDPTGTLYIGRSIRLSRRLNELRRAALGRGRLHSAPKMLRRFPLEFPANKLAVALLFTRGVHPSTVETDLIEAYMNSFGDAPPLNYRL